MAFVNLSELSSTGIAFVSFYRDSGKWLQLPGEYPTRSDAEWAVAIFKQANSILDDRLFRTVEADPELRDPTVKWE